MPPRSGRRYCESQTRRIRQQFAPCCLCCGRNCSRAPLRSVLEAAAEKRSSGSYFSWQGSSATATEMLRRKVGNVSDIPSQCVSMPISLLRATNSNKTDGACESGTRSGGIPPRQGGVFLGMRERGESVDSRDALQWVLGSACANQHQRGGVRKSPCWCKNRNGCMQSRQRFLHQLGRHSRAVPEHGTTGRVCERWRNEANCSESEQTIHRQTGLGSGGTGTSSCSTELVWKCSTCASDAQCWTRRIASSGPDCQLD